MRVRYRRSARADLEHIHAFIAESNPRAARRVVAEIREQVASLSSFPDRCRIGDVEGTRELVIKYGHIVVYRIEASWVEILSIFHAAQDKPRGS